VRYAPENLSKRQVKLYLSRDRLRLACNACATRLHLPPSTRQMSFAPAQPTINVRMVRKRGNVLRTSRQSNAPGRERLRLDFAGGKTRLDRTHVSGRRPPKSGNDVRNHPAKFIDDLVVAVVLQNAQKACANRATFAPRLTDESGFPLRDRNSDGGLHLKTRNDGLRPSSI